MKVSENFAGQLTIGCYNSDGSTPTREFELPGQGAVAWSSNNDGDVLTLNYDGARVTVICRARQHPVYNWQEVQGTVVGEGSYAFV